MTEDIFDNWDIEEKSDNYKLLEINIDNHKLLNIGDEVDITINNTKHMYYKHISNVHKSKDISGYISEIDLKVYDTFYKVKTDNNYLIFCVYEVYYGDIKVNKRIY